jgi:hypothetical protein|nr:MAG TPA: hypothetical protein [Caudoviricetes sp.]
MSDNQNKPIEAYINPFKNMKPNYKKDYLWMYFIPEKYYDILLEWAGDVTDSSLIEDNFRHSRFLPVLLRGFIICDQQGSELSEEHYQSFYDRLIEKLSRKDVSIEETDQYMAESNFITDLVIKPTEED